jgi:phage baseplate assembly protein W
MNEGLSVKLPLQKDKKFGFLLNTTYEDMILQNLKNLALTSPGERVWDPKFGVGLRRYLFELQSGEINVELAMKINEQVETYMPFIEILDVEVLRNTKVENMLNVTLSFLIKPLQKSETLDISFLI